MGGPDAKEKQEVTVHYVNSEFPYVLEESFDGYHFDLGDLHLAELLQDQESLYLSLQKNPNDRTRSSSSDDSKQEHASQLEQDEAVARSLQEFENHLSLESLSAATTTGSANIPSTSRDTPTQPAEQDDVDPDNMSYEELQSLGESIGNESRGLSDELISFLPSSICRVGLFSRKEKQECVICCMTYKSKDVIITLPCKHSYHSSCITQWLKINKTCPVCNAEVFGS